MTCELNVKFKFQCSQYSFIGYGLTQLSQVICGLFIVKRQS
jgi:hypothetical protein